MVTLIVLSSAIVTFVTTFFLIIFGVYYLFEAHKFKKYEKLQKEIKENPKNKEELQKKLDKIRFGEGNMDLGEFLKKVFKIFLISTVSFVISAFIFYKVVDTYRYTTRELVNETKVASTGEVIKLTANDQKAEVTVTTTDKKEMILKEYNIKNGLKISKPLSILLFFNVLDSEKTKYELLVPKQ